MDNYSDLGLTNNPVDYLVHRPQTLPPYYRPPVKVRLAPGATMPQYAHDTDSGADLFSMEELVLSPGETHAFSTGVFIELPVGYEAQVRSKSGLAVNYSLFVLNSPGTVDNGYRGEVKVILHNSSNELRKVSKGQKIAQMVVTPYRQAAFTLVEDLSTTERGEGGFGSTGNTVNDVINSMVGATKATIGPITTTTLARPQLQEDAYHGTEDGRGPDFADKRRDY